MIELQAHGTPCQPGARRAEIDGPIVVGVSLPVLPTRRDFLLIGQRSLSVVAMEISTGSNMFEANRVPVPDNLGLVVVLTQRIRSLDQPNRIGVIRRISPDDLLARSSSMRVVLAHRIQQNIGRAMTEPNLHSKTYLAVCRH